MIKLVTSIGQKRLDRQKKCIASWLKAGCEVTAVQSAGESEQLQEHFPDVQFVETDLVGDMFDNSHVVRVSAMTALAVDEPILILNSDLEIRCRQERFKDNWSSVAVKELKVGIRWDENITTRKTSMFKWGIDAFLITPQIAKDLPDIGMAIGKPAWDYFIPWHLVNVAGYELTVYKDRQFIHEDHQRNWSSKDYQTGLQLFENHYGVTSKELTEWVQVATGRQTLLSPAQNRRIRPQLVRKPNRPYQPKLKKDKTE